MHFMETGLNSETVQDTAEFIDKFQENTAVQVHQTVAAIDGLYIPIKAPKHHKKRLL